jgi:hypothetical protein
MATNGRYCRRRDIYILQPGYRCPLKLKIIVLLKYRLELYQPLLKFSSEILLMFAYQAPLLAILLLAVAFLNQHKAKSEHPFFF